MTLGFYGRNNLRIILTRIQRGELLWSPRNFKMTIGLFFYLFLSAMVFISCTNLRLMYSSFPFAKFDKIQASMDSYNCKKK